MLGFLDFPALSEILLIAAVALIVFGKDLPRIAMRAAVHLARMRRQLTDVWRDTGLEDEMRKVRREIERESAPSRPRHPAAPALDRLQPRPVGGNLPRAPAAPPGAGEGAPPAEELHRTPVEPPGAGAVASAPGGAPAPSPPAPEGRDALDRAHAHDAPDRAQGREARDQGREARDQGREARDHGRQAPDPGRRAPGAREAADDFGRGIERRGEHEPTATRGRPDEDRR